MHESRLKGNFCGGYLLYGYKLDGKKILIDEDKAEIVRHIYAEYASGVLMKDIRKELTDKGILHHGAPFKMNTLYNILHNEKYSGVYHHNGQEYTNAYPQIVPTPLFNRVQQIIASNKIGKRSVEVIYFLREKLFCGYCGKPMGAETGTSQNGTVKYYYKCSGRKKQSACKKKTVRKDDLEQIIIDVTHTLFNSPDIVNFLADKVIERYNKLRQDRTVLNILIKEQEETQRSIENMLNAIEKGILTASTKERLDKLELKLSEINCKIAAEQNKHQESITKVEILRFFEIALKQKPQTMIQILIKRILLYDDKIKIEYNYTDKPNPDQTGRDFLICAKITESETSKYRPNAMTGYSVTLIPPQEYI